MSDGQYTIRDRAAAVGAGLSLLMCVWCLGAEDATTHPGPPPLQLTPAANQTTAGQPAALTLGLHTAVLMALDNNASFQIERLQPAISRTDEDVERAAFDPALSGSAEIKREETESDTAGVTETETSDAVEGRLGLTETLPSGTTLALGAAMQTASSTDGADSDSDSTSWEATLSQSLLRGAGTGANLARLRQARLDIQMSLYEFRAAAETLVAQVEQAYWNLILAERSMDIYVRSMQIALDEINEVRERIRVGKMAETELAAAEAEAASRREQLIDARGTRAKRHLDLVHLVNPGGESVWTRPLQLKDAPETDVQALDEVAAYVQSAMHQRADLNQARLNIERGELEITRTRNGLLPRLDLFVALGGSRYAASFSDTDDTDQDGLSYAAGLTLDVPLGNRQARARHRRAMLSQEQAKAALLNMEQLVQVDVRTAYVDVQRSAERVNATKATRVLREETLESELEKFRVGRSTTFLVAQARRDMVASQIAEVEAIIGYRKALLALHRLDGSLLTRRNIVLEEAAAGR